MEFTTGSMGASVSCGCTSVQGRPGIDGYFRLGPVREVISAVGALSRAEEISYIISQEWTWFDVVRGLEGRASCQDDAVQFFVYRMAQYLAFPADVIALVARDCERCAAEGRNLIEEKYARMMRATDPERYAHTWASRLGEPSPVRKAALEDVAAALLPMADAVARELPESARHARVEASMSGRVSAVDYFLSEVEGYSLDTLWRLAEGLRAKAKRHESLIAETYGHSVALLRAIQGERAR